MIGGTGHRVIDPDHLRGVMRLWGAKKELEASPPASTVRKVVGDSTLLRSLSEYEALFDGSSALAAGGAP